MNDTSPDAEQVLVGVFRRMSPAKKWQQLGATYQDARILHRTGYLQRHPGATDRDVLRDWMVVNLNVDLPAFSGVLTMQNLPTLREVITVFDRLAIPYALGGSMASSLYGISRHTLDADLTAEPFPGCEEEFAGAFGPDYYLSLAAIQDAVRRRSSFNIINTATGFKIDVFVRQDQPFEQSAMSRRVPMTFPDAADQPVLVYSPEDVILFKLRWYRLGGETSEQQWKDVVGVLRVQAGRLDEDYLEHWGYELRLTDLLTRAWQDSTHRPEP